jgi:hypothetical protein
MNEARWNALTAEARRAILDRYVTAYRRGDRPDYAARPWADLPDWLQHVLTYE